MVRLTPEIKEWVDRLSGELGQDRNVLVGRALRWLEEQDRMVQLWILGLLGPGGERYDQHFAAMAKTLRGTTEENAGAQGRPGAKGAG